MRRIIRTHPLLVLLALAGFASLFASARGAAELADKEHRGGLVGWARLITPDKKWSVHVDRDPKLARFIQSQTTLNIDPKWNGVAPKDIGELCAYPFIYAKDLTFLKQAEHLKNLQEYLKRGGFLLIDPCVTRLTESDKLELIEKHVQFFSKLLPDCTVRDLPDDHEIFHCFFSVAVDDLYTPDMIHTGRIKKPHVRLRGFFRNERMIAVLTTDGLECGWPETPQREDGCLKMIVNSYIYAMTR